MCGGLGNQLFQYAFGRALSFRSGLPLILDGTSLFQRDRIYRRHYELDAFHLPEEVTVLRKSQFLHPFRRKIKERRNQNLSLDTKTFLREASTSELHHEVLDWKPSHSVTVLGYWQSEVYFQQIADCLREELRYKHPFSSSAIHWRNRIEAEPHAVALHARRIQYAARLPEDYQERAMGRMREECPGARFYLFSDDPVWAADLSQRYEDVQHVLLEPANSLEEFELMRACKHFIIANSSFSWWAAWLGEMERSVVLAPESKVWNHPNAIPERWRQFQVEEAV